MEMTGRTFAVSVESSIGDVTSVAAGLAAIAIAVLVLGPTLIQSADDRMGAGLGRHQELRRLRTTLSLLAVSSLFFLISVATGLAGLFFPVTPILIVQVALVGVGLVLTTIAVVLVLRSRLVTPSSSDLGPF